MKKRIIETDGKAIVLDLSTGAKLRGQAIAGLDVANLGKLIDRSMEESGTGFSFGRWGEPRELYSNENFASEHGDESRTVHMGIDVFCAADTPVYAPLDGVVEHLANNDAELDYGPLLILRHQDDVEKKFFTLYGHLSLDTLNRMTVGQSVMAGEQIASVGEPPTNGNWPPHLHFQLIADLLGLNVNFPGVARKSEQSYWLGLSPSPAEFFPEIDRNLLEYSECN